MPAATQPPEILGLLSDPLRWQLVRELGRSDRRVGELVQLVGKPQNLVSYHLGALRNAGVVTARRSSADGRDVYYRADLLRCRDLMGQAGGRLHAGLGPAPADADRVDEQRSRRPRLLFLCTGNSARSQIAEAFADQLSAGAVDARSAGSHPKPLHPHAVAVMAERGIDIADRATKPLSRFARSRFDRVITLCDRVREICPDFLGRPVAAHWSVAEPSSYPDFEQVADEIEGRVALLLADLGVRPLERTSRV